jgi:mannose-6-phosphate isomerase-like protein (cupin superfamily)
MNTPKHSFSALAIASVVVTSTGQLLPLTHLLPSVEAARGAKGRSLAFLVALCLCLLTLPGYGQHHSERHTAAKVDTPSLHFVPVLSQALRDPALGSYSLQSQLLRVPPAFLDTVAHRHEGEVFGYVLEGSVEVQLEKQPIVAYQAGQMFYEPIGLLHRVLRNPHPSQPAKVLLLFIIREGRQAYRREYPAAKSK